MDPKDVAAGEMSCETGIDKYTEPCIEWVTEEGLLCGAGNSTSGLW